MNLFKFESCGSNLQAVALEKHLKSPIVGRAFSIYHLQGVDILPQVVWPYFAKDNNKLRMQTISSYHN